MESYRNWPVRYVVIACAALTVVAVAGCGGLGRYLGHVSVAEAKILLSMQSIDAALQDKRWTPEQRQAARWIQRVVQDAGPQLGLESRRNQYRYVSRLDPDFRLWVLVLAEAGRLETVTWTFPIVGEVPYLGFFDRDLAEQMAARRFPDKERYLRTAAAFSTLGYLPEPVLPELLTYPPEALVNTVVHELVHSSIYIPGQPDFNETVATALGDAGAEVLLRHWGEHELLEAARAHREDRAQWARLIDDVLRHLAASYALAGSDTAAVKAAKAAGIEAFRREVRNAQWHNPRYYKVADAAINHAFLLAQRTYAANPTRQTEWYFAARDDFSGTLHVLKQRAKDESDLWAPLSH